ncbi:hypothetical protein [Spiroplasma cantharicola]|uniref:Uncharacterized protein n=1 Tax=Spiroplasma cantharicola TaxID=362837 RepID=A0A0M5KEF8_9MOLU|nr:hypothetical protein [Spiroplasma cantharicola]ALD66313.1 hypothetical protein SCANT_v1c04030 [Spiroplasma cantharicola]
MKDKSALLLIILLILAIIPGVVYWLLHPQHKLITLILLLILAIIPGVLYLIWPKGGYAY